MVAFGSHCGAAREFAFEQFIHAVKRAEIIEIEVFVFDLDAELFLQKLHELKGHQRVYEPERKNVFVIFKIVIAHKSGEKLFYFFFPVDHSLFTPPQAFGLSVVVIKTLAAFATE